MFCWSTIWRILTGLQPEPTPPSKVQVTYATACRFVSILGYPIDTASGAVNLLALEGARLGSLPDLVEIHDNPHASDLYNDSLILFGKVEGRSWSRVLPATTEPGRFYTEVNPHREGAANLVWGHHLYKQGKHRGYLALISASGYDRIWRDKDADYTQNLGERVYEGQFGIHIHAGGKRKEIGKWSAGCIAIQGGYEGEAYRFFLQKIEKHPSKLFNLILWGAQDLARWMVGGVHWCPCLYSGIQGSWICSLQRALNDRLGISPALVEDGDWGLQTQKALDRFCDRRGLPRTCQVDAELWRLLGG